MPYRIIYPTLDSGVAIVVPCPNSELSPQELAAQTVPFGVPYKLIKTSDVPTDRTFRNAWEYQE